MAGKVPGSEGQAVTVALTAAGCLAAVVVKPFHVVGFTPAAPVSSTLLIGHQPAKFLRDTANRRCGDIGHKTTDVMCYLGYIFMSVKRCREDITVGVN